MADPSNPVPEPSTLDMVRAAVDEARTLLQVEVKLAREELQRDVQALKVTAILLVLGSQVGILALGMLLVSAVLGLSSQPPAAALVVGSLLLVVAAGLVALGLKQRPNLLQDTKQRLSKDRKLIKDLEAHP